jgi:F-type H+-transporting ATPase subunit delta
VSEKHLPKVVAGENAVLAQRYALALLELAEERNVTDVVSGDLDVLEEAVTGNPDFRLIAKHPRFHTDKVYAAVEDMAGAGRLSELTASFLRRVAKGRRLALLGYMIDAFRTELAEKRGEKTALVSAPCALSEAQKTALSEQLGKLTGGKVDLILQEDKGLLGGLTVKLGSRLIDASVKGKLAQIERQLKSQREAA